MTKKYNYPNGGLQFYVKLPQKHDDMTLEYELKLDELEQLD